LPTTASGASAPTFGTPISTKEFPMSSGPYLSKQPTRGNLGYKDALFGVASLLLGLLVAVLGFVALMMWLDARTARHDARQAPAKVTTTAGAMDMGSTNLRSLTSYAGAAPADADALAAALPAHPA